LGNSHFGHHAHHKPSAYSRYPNTFIKTEQEYRLYLFVDFFTLFHSSTISNAVRVFYSFFMISVMIGQVRVGDWDAYTSPLEIADLVDGLWCA